MFNSISVGDVVAPSKEGLPNPQWEMVLSFDGEDNSTKFVDLLGKNTFKSIGGAHLSTQWSKHGRTSLYIERPRSGAQQSLSENSSGYVQLKDGQFTLKSWIKLLALGSPFILCARDSTRGFNRNSIKTVWFIDDQGQVCFHVGPLNRQNVTYKFGHPFVDPNVPVELKLIRDNKNMLRASVDGFVCENMFALKADLTNLVEPLKIGTCDSLPTASKGFIAEFAFVSGYSIALADHIPSSRPTTKEIEC